MGSPTIKIPMKDSLPFTTNELIHLNIDRLKERVKTVFSNKNPYINPVWEKTEIEQWIGKLEKILK